MALHALKNSMIPVLTLAGLNLLIMVNVAIVIEVIFNWPGVGQLLRTMASPIATFPWSRAWCSWPG